MLVRSGVIAVAGVSALCFTCDYSSYFKRDFPECYLQFVC